MKYQLYTHQGLVGGLYQGDQPSDTVAVYAIGAPIPPDNGTLPDVPILIAGGVDVFVPDYYGYGRSDGRFTPESCMRTLIDSCDWLAHGDLFHNGYTGENKRLRYRKIIAIGRSFGANFVALLPQKWKGLILIGLVSPCVDNKSQGQVEGEETNEAFLRSMRDDGYHHLYRGILDPIWSDHLEGKDWYDAMAHVTDLGETKVFIGHGKSDSVVHYSKAERYRDKLEKVMNPSRVKLCVYSGGHGPETTNLACQDMINWLSRT